MTATAPTNGFVTALSKRIGPLAGKAIVAAGFALTAGTVVLIPRGGVNGPVALVPLLGMGIALVACCIVLVHLLVARRRSGACGTRLARIAPAWVVAVGAVLQVAAAIALQPVQQSDSAAYLMLSHRLAAGATYRDVGGFLAFWPPGYPLYLVPFVALLPSDFWALLAANLLLYLVSCAAVLSLATTLFDRRVAVFAVLLFTAWPSRFFASTYASKETLAIALVAASLAIAAALVAGRPRRVNDALAAALGLVLGFAALAQPGLTLLFSMYPIGFASRWRRFGFARLARLVVLTFVGFACVVGPWMFRNHVVFDGRFHGIATNGGSVFYRANNDNAGVEYSPRGTVDLSSLSELEQNRVGFELGKAWILTHPLAEAMLAARKFAALLDNDAQGVYWALQRNRGVYEASNAGRSSGWYAFVAFAHLMSTWFWMIVCAAVAYRCAAALRAGAHVVAAIVPLLLPLLYCVVVFALFESGARQHMFAVPALIVIAASNLRRPEAMS